MKRLFVLVLTALCVGVYLPEAQIRTVVTSQEVKFLLVPILETYRSLRTNPKCTALTDPVLDYPGLCSQLHDRLGSQVLLLSHTKGTAADEALAALFSFGLHKDEGDQGHDFVCMAAFRDGGMRKALSKYRSCEVDIKSDYPEWMRSDTTICQRAIQRAIDVIRTHSVDKVCTAD